MTEPKKWTLEDIEENIKINVKDYGAVVPVAALFLKLYGRLPKIGMSGAQAGFAKAIAKAIPDKEG